MSIKIVSDSTCDLSEELIEHYNINIIPLHIVLGDKEYEDGKNITPDDIYKWSDENKTTPNTAAPSIAEVSDLFKELISDGSELICFSISENMSATNNIMKMAVSELELNSRIRVINSENLSTGVGILVIEAAIMAQECNNADTIIKEIEKLKPRVRASFVLNTLTYLHRGGRCSGLTALAGGALKIHPKIIVENGKMNPNKKYRGKMDNVIINYVTELKEHLIKAKKDRVFITHSGCDINLINMIKKILQEMDYFEEILVTQAGGVISSHCGPGTLGVIYIE